MVFDSQSSNLQMSVRYDFHSSSFYKLSVLLLPSTVHVVDDNVSTTLHTGSDQGFREIFKLSSLV